MQSGKTKESIIKEEKLSENEFTYILDAFKNNGIIGLTKREKFNILYMKFALFNVDRLLGTVCEWLKCHNKIMFMSLVNITFFILMGLVIAISSFEDIFRVKYLKLPLYQYFLAYCVYFIIIFFHELGHGFTCKYFGGKVGKVGIAFILFNPAMYCDISDVRMFKEKYKQILSSIAGFIVNAVFIGIFSIFYIIFKTNFFRVMIILNVTSILINALPFVRLDGYWTLSFAIGVHNLYKKSIKKVVSLGQKNEFINWKDYFILGYGIINCIIIFYCCTQFATELVRFVLEKLPI